MDLLVLFPLIFLLLGELFPYAYTTHKKNLNYNPGDMSNSDIVRGEEYNKERNPFVEETNFLEVKPVPFWPSSEISFGQVSGVSLDLQGNVYVFHRDKRSWDKNSFLLNNTFAEIYLGPISNPTVAVIHPKTGTLLYSWGQNMFYLPHGITVDSQNNIWITDVAMHQVFKFPPILKSGSGNTNPLLQLGTKFVPGSSKFKFCKPSAVAVLPSGEFFVSDGYCNARVMKFAADGSLLTEWGRSTLTRGIVEPPPYYFNVPHDLTLIDDRNLVCVSDRENGRIQCFQTTNGSFVFEINRSHEIGYRLFSASYTSAAGGLFFIVNGPVLMSDLAHGSVIHANDMPKLINTFQPAGEPFENPHDVIVSPSGSEVYVAELNPHRVCKFQVNYQSVKTPVFERQSSEDEKSSGTMLMAIFITAVVICFGAVLLAAALIYSKARTRGRSLLLEDLELESRMDENLL